MAKDKKAPASQLTKERPNITVPLKDIVANSYQSRGMGALAVLKELGYGLFEKISVESEYEPIWPALTGDDPKKREEAAKLIAANEEEVITLAKSIAEHGQLEDIGVTRDKDGKYDIVYGMQRSVALAFMQVFDPLADKALTPTPAGKYPTQLNARLYPADMDETDLKLIAHEENVRRKQESAVDRAMFYRDFIKENKLTPAQFAVKIDMSTQHVKDYLTLLDPMLDKDRIKLHSGEMSVDAAVKKVRNAKNGAASSTANTSDPSGRDRRRFPSLKTIGRIYDGIRPRDFDDTRWARWTSAEVRDFLADEFGFKKVAFVEKAAEAPKVKGKKGKAGQPAADATKAAEAPAGKGATVKVKRSTANKLLVCLGQTNAATWTDAKVAEKLENIPALAEEGTKVEDTGAQKLLDILFKNFAKGVKVKLEGATAAAGKK